MIPFEVAIVREKAYKEYVMRKSLRYGHMDCLKKLREEIEVLNKNGGGINDMYFGLNNKKKRKNSN